MIAQNLTRTLPQRAALAVEQAVAALRTGDAGEAERVLRVHLLGAPADTAALTKLAEILIDRGEVREAVLVLRRALQVAPSMHHLRLALARILLDLGEPHQALEQVDLLPAELRATFDVETLRAALLGILGRHEPEIAIYRRLAKCSPHNPALWMSLGNALKYAGRAEEAVAALRQAVAARPSYGEGWWSLANIKSARFDERELAVMRRALGGKIDPNDALHLHFALGKALEDRGQYRQSFDHYDAGNRIRARACTPESMSATRLVNDIIATFDAGLMSRAGAAGNQADDPIFVVGLQRSGSTLVEQILASHPQIEGTSELMVMQQIWTELVRSARARRQPVRDYLLELPDKALADLGADYLERTRPFRTTGRPYFVDKLPANWMNVGLIRLVLPKAKIIDARRSPMACGFSNFKQHYATGVAFAYSQDSIGRFYRDYLRAMRHFTAVQPGAMHLVVNEDLVEHTELEVRRMLEFVGVPFDAACLEFHRNKRSVNTASAEQVRRPINRDGLEGWRNYEPWLAPLKRALAEAVGNWR